MSSGRLCWKLGKTQTQREARNVLWMLKLSELYVHTFNIESNRPRAAEVCAVVNQVARQVGKDRLTAYHGILAQEKPAFSN